MKQIENYKPRIREKCRVCKIYLPAGCMNDICLKCSRKMGAGFSHLEYLSWRDITQG
jgi:hypothetical protein